MGDKEEHYIKIKGSIHQEYIILINMQTPNVRSPKYLKQILIELKGEISSSTIIGGDFNTTFSNG